MSELCEYEIDILRMMNGEDVKGLSWGAAMSVAIESLHGRGFVTGPPNYQINDKGREYLANITTPKENE